MSSDNDDPDSYPELQAIFFDKLYLEHPSCTEPFSCTDPFFYGRSTGYQISVQLRILNPEKSENGLDVDEGFELEIIPPKKGTIIYIARITSGSYFGARHGLETLGQLISYDDITDSLQTYTYAHITDAPVFPYRGVMIDTARNFMSTDEIKKIIDGLSYNKLNVLHWHITDAESFPFSTKTNKSLEGFQLSDLSKWGAYSEEKMYSSKIIDEIVRFAKVRGVRVLPEIDTPGHVHSGWGGFEGENPSLGKLLLCREPNECSTPPCGQVISINSYSPSKLKHLCPLFQYVL